MSVYMCGFPLDSGTLRDKCLKMRSALRGPTTDAAAAAARVRTGAGIGPAQAAFPRLGGLRADRREVLRERRRRSRLALSSLLDTYHFCIVGRDQKLRIGGSSSSQVARSNSLREDRRGARGWRRARVSRVRKPVEGQPKLMWDPRVCAVGAARCASAWRICTTGRRSPMHYTFSGVRLGGRLAVLAALVCAAALMVALVGAADAKAQGSNSKTFLLPANTTKTFQVRYPFALQFKGVTYSCRATVSGLGKRFVKILSRGSALGG